MPQAVKQHSTRHYPRVLSQDVRNTIEAAVEAHLDAIAALTACLDDADTDHDLEEGGDLEPSLGGTGGISSCDAELDEADDEPSLAHTLDMNQATAQKHLGLAQFRDGTWFGMGEDREAQHDGREREVGI